jgi:hypothetical protein
LALMEMVHPLRSVCMLLKLLLASTALELDFSRRERLNSMKTERSMK